MVFESLSVGDEFSIEDGFYEFVVTKKLKNGIIAQISENGVIKNRKGMNVMGKDLNLPSLLDEDLDKLDNTCKQKMDFVALSFTRNKKDIITLKNELDERKIDAKIVAKIESKSGIDNLDEIIEETLGAVSSERTSRVIDQEAAASMERRKREGYF